MRSRVLFCIFRNGKIVNLKTIYIVSLPLNLCDYVVIMLRHFVSIMKYHNWDTPPLFSIRVEIPLHFLATWTSQLWMLVLSLCLSLSLLDWCFFNSIYLCLFCFGRFETFTTFGIPVINALPWMIQGKKNLLLQGPTPTLVH